MPRINTVKFLNLIFSSFKEVSALWNEFILWSKGHIDVLVNNASFVKPMPLENLSEEEWDKNFSSKS